MATSLVRLPSLDLIRGFVAVGRRMSITLAAEDFCLTQSAVSRQIHALEEAVGAKLLNRGYRSISFTAEGERLFRISDSVMQHLQDVVGCASGSRGHNAYHRTRRIRMPRHARAVSEIPVSRSVIVAVVPQTRPCRDAGEASSRSSQLRC